MASLPNNDQPVASEQKKSDSTRSIDDNGQDLTPRKKIRSQPPDVIVAVGSDDAMQEFQCYKVILSFASEYLDAMLSAGMREDETSRIEFPDKCPDEWQLFYDFIDPAKIGRSKNKMKEVNENNVTALLPWFHEFQMKDYLDDCDNIFSGQFSKDMSRPLSLSGTRKSHFEKQINLLQNACRYDLTRTNDKVGDWIAKKMACHSSSDLFDLTAIKALVPLILPLERCENGLKSGGKCKRLWPLFESVLSPHTPNLSHEIMNENIEIFSLLVHSYTQQKMAKSLADAKEKDSTELKRNIERMKSSNFELKNQAIKSRELIQSWEKRANWLTASGKSVIHTLTNEVPKELEKMFKPKPSFHYRPSYSNDEQILRSLREIIGKKFKQNESYFQSFGVLAISES